MTLYIIAAVYVAVALLTAWVMPMVDSDDDDSLDVVVLLALIWPIAWSIILVFAIPVFVLTKVAQHGARTAQRRKDQYDE